MATTARKLIGHVDAVTEGVAMYAAGTPARDAAAAIYDRGLTPDALARFAIRGLASFIHDGVTGTLRSVHEGEADSETALESRTGLAPRGRNAPVAVHHGAAFWRAILARPFEGAEGKPKTLLAFTLADTEAFVAKALGQVSGWGRRAKAMERAGELLRHSGRTTIGDLSEAAKVEIAEILR